MTTSTPRYHHERRYYRVVGRTIGHQLASIGYHLDRVGTPDADLVARLDDLTDVILAVNAKAGHVLTDLEDAEVSA